LQVLVLQGEPQLPEAYRHRLLLCRSDQHVVWRGDALPDVAALLARLRGAVPH